MVQLGPHPGMSATPALQTCVRRHMQHTDTATERGILGSVPLAVETKNKQKGFGQGALGWRQKKKNIGT